MNPEDNVFELFPKGGGGVDDEYHQKNLEDLLGVVLKGSGEFREEQSEKLIPCSLSVTKKLEDLTLSALLSGRARTSVPIFRAVHYLSTNKRMILHGVPGQGTFKFTHTSAEKINVHKNKCPVFF